jgi:hypothetical protein
MPIPGSGSRVCRSIGLYRLVEVELATAATGYLGRRKFCSPSLERHLHCVGGDYRASFRDWGGHERMTRAMAMGLISGAAIGLLAGLAVGAGAESADEVAGFMKSILYALGELAVDTEMNAVRIEALSARVDELEARLNGPAAPGK